MISGLAGLVATAVYIGRSDGYYCTGNISGWTKCTYMTRNPKRSAFKVPAEYNDVPFLKSYKYQKRERLFAKATLAASSVSHLALTGLKFFHFGKLILPVIQCTSLPVMGGGGGEEKKKKKRKTKQ